MLQTCSSSAALQTNGLASASEFYWRMDLFKKDIYTFTFCNGASIHSKSLPRPTDRPPRIATPQTQRWSAHPGRPKLPIAIPPNQHCIYLTKKHLRRETVLSFKFISLNCGGRIESQAHLFNNLHTKKTVPLVPMWRVKRGRLFPTVPEQRDITLIVCCLDLWRSPRVRRTH